MKKPVIIVIALLAVLKFVAPANAQPMTFYHELTDSEMTVSGYRLVFWTPDTVWGPLRTNDYLLIKLAPNFFDQVITAQSRFLYDHEDHARPHFRFEPVLNAAPYRFPDDLSYLKLLPGYHFDDDGGRLLTTLRFEGWSVSVFQRALGEFGEDSLIATLPPDRHWIARPVIYVDGEVNVSGVVQQYWTVYATGDIGLIDNFVYSGSDRRTGFFNPANVSVMAALVSEKNIIIRNTPANGREDGYNQAQDDWDRHSIAINGSMIALHESFTFEDQNNDWDMYQGPTFDERGAIYLTGGIAQKRRGYIHLSNHTGTGYWHKYRYDERLRRDAPPGFAAGEAPNLTGHFGTIRLYWYHPTYTFTDVTADELDVPYYGTHINLESGNALTVLHKVTMQGTQAQPIIVSCPTGVAAINVPGGDTLNLAWVEFGSGVELNFSGTSFQATNCTFNGKLTIEGAVKMDSCQFNGAVQLSGFGEYEISHSLIRAGVTVSGARSDGRIENCTIVESGDAGILLRGKAQPVVDNCIIAYNRTGIQNNTRYEPQVRFSDIFGNTNELVDLEVGEGCISIDSQSSDRLVENYHLDWDSPCIDAGDPASPRDPDGSRVEMGAFYFDKELAVRKDEFGMRNLEYEMEAAPNPFNSTTNIHLLLSSSSEITLVVKDLTGRTIEQITDHSNMVGPKIITLHAIDWPNGVYFVRVEAGSKAQSLKLVKIN